MSGSFVIDASVGLAWVHPAQATSETDRLLDEVAAGHSPVVPAIWFLEMANVLLAVQRRRRLTPEQRKAALITLGHFDLVVDEEGHRMAFSKTSEIAEKHGLSVYDAAYLELATRRKLPLASRDEALLSAAKKAGVRVL